MSTTATATRALEIARTQLGYVRDSDGTSKYGEWYGIPKGAFCAMFASWVLDQAGLDANVDYPKHAWTPSGVAWGKARGRFHRTNPQVGDLVYFMWSTVSPNGRGNPPVCHVGIVEAVRADGSIVTIEGNTSSTIGGSQYNGGTVARKVRSGSVIQGYVTPNYDGWYDGPLGSRTILPGDRGEDVKALQAWYNANTDFEPKLEEDGSNGPLTQGRTRDYQGSVGAEVDGIPGPETFGKMGITYTGGSTTTPTPKPTTPSGKLELTGILDKPTILAIQKELIREGRLDIKPDGIINGLYTKGGRVGNSKHSPTILAWQRKRGSGVYDGRISTPRSRLVYKEQQAQGTRRDWYITAGGSTVIRKVQEDLNAGRW